MKIKESVIVEGRDDATKVLSCVSCNIIVTHGYGIRKSVWKEIAYAYEHTGIIIFTDPDSPGKRIRESITSRFPKAKHAYLRKEQALKKDDIGIENASCEDILSALEKVRSAPLQTGNYTMEDMVRYRLTGPSSRERRDYVSHRLSLGHNNVKGLLKKLNHYNVERTELEQCLKDYEGGVNAGNHRND